MNRLHTRTEGMTLSERLQRMLSDTEAQEAVIPDFHYSFYNFQTSERRLQVTGPYIPALILKILFG